MNQIDKKMLASSIRDKYFPDSTFIGPYEAAGYHVPICEEQWLWLNRDKIKGVVLDMSTPRFWHEFIYDLEGVTRVLISEYGSEEVSKYGKSSRADIVGDFCRTPPPLEPNSVDTVLCLSILEHCEDMLAMFRNIFTILKPGGNAFFWTPYAYVDGHLTPDYWRIGRDGYRLLAKKTGFKMIDERNFGDMGKYLINDFGIDASANKAHRGIPIAFAIICSKPSETSTRASKPHVECPVCKSTYDEFAPYGATPRGNALCPNCGSLERHRLLWLFLEQKTNLFKDNLKVLDIAPTRGLSEIFKSMRNLDYLSIDKNSPVAMKSMDITQLECEDNSFDCVLCYHVLEHVTDDDKALEELYRVLKPGGWAIIQVPIDKGREKTLEGTHISDPKKRRELFGQEDHFRSYGLDYPLKLARKGFQVTRDDFARHLSKDVTDSYRIFQDEEIFYCRKPQDASPTGHKKNETTISNASICHLVYEHEFIETYNRLISENFDISEHLFIVYSSHSWESDKKFNLSNSYYIHDFKDERLLNYLSKARLIVAHCLYHSSLISFLFENQKLLGKLVWKLWGGDLYLYRQAGTKANPFDNEEKRKQVIKNIGFIASPVEDEFNHIREIYKTNAQYLFAFYPSFVDYREIRLPETHRNDSTLNILVGNSAYPTSNHLQAFSLLEKYAGQPVRIYCPLSYGDKKYAEEISTAGKKIFGDKFIPMLDFLPFDKYVEFLSTIDIAVMNHDRQQALGNILTLLHLGKKVYLRQEITSYKSLKKLGFSLSTISSLQTDDFADLSRFSKNEAKCNSSLIVKLFSRKNCVEAWRKVFETPPSENKEPGARQPYGKLVGNTSARPGEERGKNTALGRVLFINHSIPPYEISGTPISTLNHVQGMKDLGYETAALIPAPDIESGFSKDQTGGYTLYRVKRFDKYEAFLGIIEQSRLREYFNVIEQVLNDFNPDIVHINDYVYMPAELVEFLKKKNITVIRNVCNCEELCHMDYPVTRSEFRGVLCSGPETAEKCAECFLINRLDRNNYTPEELSYFTDKIRERHNHIAHLYRTAVDGVTFTEASFKDYFTKYVEIPEDKVTVIPRGIPPFHADGEASAPRMETEKVNFAFIGNIMFCKGIDVALQAFDTIKDKNNFRLDIFGAAVNREYLQWMQSLEDECPDKFKYHGKYDKSSFGDIVKNIDICIVPSYFDTYNRIIREVMRYGVPVIATDFFGASIIQHGVNGLKFPVGDHRQLAEIIKNLAETPSMIRKLSDGALNTRIPTLNDELLGLHEFYKKIWKSSLRKDNSIVEPASLCKLIAFHLPQFHPIPENDAWWGEGFTEWTNVAKAQPIFDGHYQPHIPAELGYYDLRNPSSMKAQASLAREYGIHGFCFYHYWFNGKLLLETPLHQMLQSGQPDFPYCLCWANEDWTRVWDGKSGEVLIKQNYNDADDIAHMEYLLQFFRDERYIRINGKPLFLVYRASQMPDSKRTTELWRDIARREGVGELYLCRVESSSEERVDPSIFGFDTAVEFQPDWNCLPEKEVDVKYGKQHVYDYGKFSVNVLKKPESSYIRYPCVLVSWDNSPRRENSIAQIFTESSPAKYGRWLQETIKRVNDSTLAEKIVFLNAWNEWAEGNHLEPDVKHGRAYLEATKNALLAEQNHKQTIAIKTCTPSRKSIGWGDTYFADALARALARLGYNCRVDCQDEWYSKPETDITIHLKGLYKYTPSVSSKNIIWIISHPELVTIEELNAFDLIFCASESFGHKIADNCLPPVRYLPQASEPAIFSPINEPHKDIDLLFVGNNYEAQHGRCRKIIADLLKTRKKYNLAVVGQQWRGYIPDNCILADFIEPEQVPLLYSRAKIVLNDHHREMQQEGFINNRTYDLALAKMFQISDHVEGMEKLSVVSYESPADLEEKLDHFLCDSAARDVVSSLVYDKCRSYTFDNRATEIITCTFAVKKISTTPLISILIPTYNRAQFLPDAISSALSQNYPDFEVIVVDDGSNDETPDTVNKFSDTRLRYFRKKHSGAPATRNRCISEAKGEFLVWLDSDDMLQPDVLMSYADALTKTPDADVLYGDLIVTDAHFRPTSGVHYQDWYGRNGDLLANLLHSNCIPNPGTIVRKSLYEKLGMYDESFRRAHDYELWTRFALKATFKRLPIKVVKWRWHDSNMSSGSVQYDTSFDARIIHNMLETYALSELFPTMDWRGKDQDKILASVYLIIAQRLLELKDVAGACEYLGKSHEVIPNPDTLQLRDKLLSSPSPTELPVAPIASNPFPSNQETTTIFSINRKHPVSAPANDNKPLVSIIVPTYNRPEMLASALRSIQSQTFQDFEVIVVNDAGVDVAPIVAHFNTKGTIRYINKETNQGLAAARNTGIRAAHGKYIAYLDDDDTYYPDHLETLVNFLEGETFQVAYSDAHRAIQEKRGEAFATVRRDAPYGDDFDADRLLVENYIPVLSVMHERKCLDEAGFFDESLPRHEDWDLWIRLSQRYPFGHIRKTTAEFTHRTTDPSGMTSGTLPSMLATLEKIYEKTTTLADSRPMVAARRKSYLFDLKNRIHHFLRKQVDALIETKDGSNLPTENDALEQLGRTGASGSQILAAYHHTLGLRSKDDDVISALTHFSRALVTDPACCPVHSSVAEILVQVGETEKAARHCEAILSQEPNDPELFDLMAAISQRLGNEAEAASWKQKARKAKQEIAAA